MLIEIYDGNLSKKDVKNNSMRIGCRAVVQHNDKILTVYETKWDLTVLPGGGLEAGESIEECVIREVLEETGIIVDNPIEMVRVVEHFEGESFTNIYFRCEYVTDTGVTTFTAIEQEVQLTTKWWDISELLTELSTNMTLSEYGPNIHNIARTV